MTSRPAKRSIAAALSELADVPPPRDDSRDWIAHQRLTKNRYLERLGDGALFFTLDGAYLASIDAVRDELAAGREVWSHR